MKTKWLFLALALAGFTSCSTVYKTGQTPDDVYYSPTRSYGEEETKRQDRREQNREENREQKEYYSFEDRSIRFGINNPRWRYIDQNFSYNPYNQNYYYNSDLLWN